MKKVKSIQMFKNSVTSASQVFDIADECVLVHFVMLKILYKRGIELVFV